MSLLLMAFINLLLLPSAFASPVPPVLQEATTDDTSDTDPPATDPPTLMRVGISSTGPQIRELKVNDKTLTICFDKRLDIAGDDWTKETDIAPAFKVFVGALETPIDVTKATTYTWCTPPPPDDGTYSWVLSLTLATSVSYGETVVVSYTEPDAETGLYVYDSNSPSDHVESFTQEVTNLTGASPTTASVDGNTLTLAYSVDLDQGSEPEASAFILHGASNWNGSPKNVEVSDDSVILTLPSRLVAEESLSLTYNIPTTKPLKDAEGLPVAKLDRQSVSNVTARNDDRTPPILESAVPAVLNRDTIELTFSKDLNEDVTMPVNAIALSVNLGINEIKIVGKTVTITLKTTAVERQEVRLSYSPTATGGHLLEDLAGNDVAPFVISPLQNDTDDTPPVLDSATVNLTTLTLTYNETLKSDSVPDPADFTVTMAEDTSVGVSRVSLADKIVTLTLSDPVIEKTRVTLSYTGRDPDRLQDTSGNFAADLEDYEVENKTDTTAPTLTEAVVNGATLTLTYDEAMVEADRPDAEDYKVTVNGKQVTVTSVALEGAVVTLTLATRVTKGAVVKVSYTPGTKQLQDKAGNRAEALDNQEVTNRTAGSGGDPTPTPAPTVPPQEPVVIAPDKPLEITRGSLTISIPAGAVTDRYRLTVAPPTDTTAVEQVGQVADVANATELDAVSETGNQPLHTFDEKITLTFHYDPAQFPDPSRLAIYWYDPVMKVWVSLGGVVDPVAGTITVTVDHFTLFAVLAPHEKAPTMDTVPATTDQQTLTVTGMAAAGSTVTLVLGGKAVASATADESGTYSMTATLAEGRNLLYVKGSGLIASNEAVVIYTPAQQPPTGDQTGEPQPGETQTGDQSGGDSQVTTPKLTDIAGHWAEAAITRLVDQGIVSGFEDQTYRPDLAISRAEFTTLLARALELKGTADLSRFTDADAIPGWARANVAAAVAAGIVNGHADGSFAPDAKITRAEAAVMLANALKYKGITAPGDPLTLSDGATIPDWAKASVQAAVNSHLITGYEDGTFRPGALTTRAEVAMMLTRLLDAR